MSKEIGSFGGKIEIPPKNTDRVFLQTPYGRLMPYVMFENLRTKEEIEKLVEEEYGNILSASEKAALIEDLSRLLNSEETTNQPGEFLKATTATTQEEQIFINWYNSAEHITLDLIIDKVKELFSDKSLEYQQRKVKEAYYNAFKLELKKEDEIYVFNALTNKSYTRTRSLNDREFLSTYPLKKFISKIGQ